jgi:hypothetical protein
LPDGWAEVRVTPQFFTLCGTDTFYLLYPTR